jgi:hypothetical protein
MNVNDLFLNMISPINNKDVSWIFYDLANALTALTTAY